MLLHNPIIEFPVMLPCPGPDEVINTVHPAINPLEGLNSWHAIIAVLIAVLKSFELEKAIFLLIQESRYYMILDD